MNNVASATQAVAATASSAPAVRESVIDRDSHFNGLYETKQDLRIEGLAEVEIQCQGTLTVAEGARVKAKVTASTITIAGELDGEVICHGVFQILPSGQVQASVSAQRLIVQEGGLYNGEFRMISAQAPAPEAIEKPRYEAPASSTDGDEAPEIGTDAWWKRFNEAAPSGAGDKSEDRLDDTA